MIYQPDMIAIHSLFLVRGGNKQRGKIWGVMLGTAYGGYLLRDNMTKATARLTMKNIAKQLGKNRTLMRRQQQEILQVAQ